MARRQPDHPRAVPSNAVTLFRHSAPNWPGGPTVHVLERRHGFMLVAPSPCKNVLAEILAETAVVDRKSFRRHDGAELTRRGYCRHCIGTLT